MYKFKHFRYDSATGKLRHYYIHGLDENDQPLCGWTPAVRGGRTVCYIIEGDEIVASGTADCSKKDVYNRRLGRDISRGRAEFALKPARGEAQPRLHQRYLGHCWAKELA